MGFIERAIALVDAAFEKHGMNRAPEPNEDPIEYAKRIGTYRKIDRAKQYEDQRYSAEMLLRNDNLLFERDRRREQSRFYYHLASTAAAAVLARAPEIYSFLMRVFR